MAPRRLMDVGGRMLAFRERRGVWHVHVCSKWGWALTFSDALRDAMRGAVS